MRSVIGLALALVIGLTGACGPTGPEPLPPDVNLGVLTLSSVAPALLVPGSDIVLTGTGFPAPGDGAISLRLVGAFTPTATGKPGAVDVRLRAVYDSATQARVPVSGDLFGAFGATEGRFVGDAILVVDSALDLSATSATPRRVELEVRRVLQPRITAVDLAGAALGTGRVHPNDWVEVKGEGFLLGGAEGRTTAVLSGCFLPDGTSGDCSVYGRRVVRVEVPARPARALDRTALLFPYSPSIHGVLPGRFVGTVSLKNEQPTLGAPSRSDPKPFAVTQVKPELRAFSPAAASLGQYIEIQGAGFIGGGTEATIVRLNGTFAPDGQAGVKIPVVDLDLVVEWVARFPPDGPVGRYVLDEADSLGQRLLQYGGLRKVFGEFVGQGVPILRRGKESVSGASIPITLRLLPVKQVVVVNFLPSYLDALRLFGLRAMDNAVRARVLEVARRDYAGVNIEFRQAVPGAPVVDFALYSQVDIGGSDPNGMAFLGYDNTPGRDMGNQRLYDRIGGVNALTQSDGSPGYGGIFAEQFLGFSSGPGRVEKLPVSAEDNGIFDSVFDPVRPDRGGSPAQVSEVGRVPALTDGRTCPATERSRQVACAVYVLGNLIGNTMTHEIGHSLGLANPRSMNASYHDNGAIRGRLMNAGGLRTFGERAEIGQPPAVFCDTEYKYLREILPGASGGSADGRPPCME
jgi:hypothetical protein